MQSVLVSYAAVKVNVLELLGSDDHHLFVVLVVVVAVEAVVAVDPGYLELVQSSVYWRIFGRTSGEAAEYYEGVSRVHEDRCECKTRA